MISKENMKWLSQFENNFNTAIKSNYTRNILESHLRKMAEIYEKATGKKYHLCTHCTSSILAFLKVIGKLYLDQKGIEPELKTNELENKVAKKERKNGKRKQDITHSGQDVGKGKDDLHN